MKIVKDEEGTEATIVEGVKPVYNPAKQYSWTPQDKFLLTGEEFGKILNACRAILSTPEAGIVLTAKVANDAVETIIAKAVAEGIVKEVPQPLQKT